MISSFVESLGLLGPRSRAGAQREECGAVGVRGSEARPVPRRAPLGAAARGSWPHERADVLARAARVWYARASPEWPRCWRPSRCWPFCPVSVDLVSKQQASDAPPRLFTPSLGID